MSSTSSSSTSSNDNIGLKGQNQNSAPMDFPLGTPSNGVSHNSGANGTHTPPERDPGPGSAADNALNKCNTAFTVDFGQEEGTGGGANRPIGELMPSGLRRSFRQREKEIKDRQESRKEEMKDQTNGEMSPARRRKAEQWTSGGSNVTRKHSLSPRRSGYHSDGHNSNLSSDNEDHSIRSDTYMSSRAKRIRQTGRSVSVTEKSSKVVNRVSAARTAKASLAESRKVHSQDSRKTPTSGLKSARKTPVDQRKTPVDSSSRKTPVDSRKTPVDRKTPTGDKKRKSGGTAAPVGVAPSETSAYLIQKMFGSSNLGTPTGSDVDSAGEYEMYHQHQELQQHMTKKSQQVLKPKASLSLPMKQSSRNRPAMEEDNLSEAGTYTIQIDKKQKEIDDARRSIDKVFGVSDSQDYDYESGLVSDPDFSPEDLPVDHVPLIRPEMADSMDPIVGSMTLRGDEADDPSKNGLWRSSNLNKSLSSTNQDILSSQLQTVASRRLRGSGRILPTPPVKTSSASHALASSLDFEATDTHTDTDSPSGRHRATVTFDSGSGGTFTISFDAPQREAKSATSGDEDSDSEAPLSSRSEKEPQENTRQFLSDLSPDSQKLMIQKKIRIVKDGAQDLPVSREELLIPIPLDSDSEDSGSMGPASAPAVIMKPSAKKPVKPVAQRSPRQSVPVSPSASTAAKDKPKYGRSKSVGGEHLKPQPSPRSPRAKTSVTRSETVSSSTRASSVTRTTSVTRRSTSRTRGSSLTRDISTSESESAFSSDYSESMASPKLSRSASAGKGTVTMAKTNRTFALRRQKTTEDTTSESSTLTPRSSRPASTTDIQKSPRSASRSSSRSRSTSRTRPISAQDSRRTDSGLGQRDRNRDNSRLSSSTGAKDISKSKSKTSTPSSSAYASPRTAKKLTDTKDSSRPRSGGSRSGSTSSSLTVNTGNRSQPNSRTSSPRTDEYNAWKRRKSYDPRQAVAEARSRKVARSKSQMDDTNQSQSSLSSEESSHQQHERNAMAAKSRTDDIIKLSTEIYQNLAAMSKDNEEADILLQYQSAMYSETETFRSRLGSDSTRSAFSSVLQKKTSPPIALDSSPSPPQPSGNGKNAQAPLSHPEDLSDDDDNEEGDDLSAENSPRNREESYNTIILRSIFEISNRVKTRTDSLMDKLQTSHDLRSSPFLDDLKLNKDTPGLLELGGILTNLRTTEKHLQMIDKALFPGPKTTGPVCNQHHLEELERIRSELADFRPIQQPPAAQQQPPTKTWGRAMHKQKSQDSERSETFQGDEYW